MAEIVKSAQRVMEIFEFFANKRASAGVGEVAAALNYPQSSTSALLHSLVRLGYVSYNPRERSFMPSLRLATLGSWLLDAAGDQIEPFQLMNALSESTGHTIVLGIEHEAKVLYMHTVTARNLLRFHMKAGSLRPIFRTAVGLALLSLKTDAEIGALARRVNAEREAGEPLVKTEDILAAIGGIRDKGYAMTVSNATPGAAVIARVLPGLPGQPPMAVGIGMPAAECIRHEAHYASLLTQLIDRRPGGDADVQTSAED